MPVNAAEGKPDKTAPCALCRKEIWRYEIHGIEGRVDQIAWQTPETGWRWLDCAAQGGLLGDFGLIVLRYPPSGITPLPLFDGDKAALTAALKAADRKVTQSGYPGNSPRFAVHPYGLRGDGLGAKQRTVASVRYATG